MSAITAAAADVVVVVVVIMLASVMTVAWFLLYQIVVFVLCLFEQSRQQPIQL